METEPRGMWVTAGPGKAAGPRAVGNNLKQLTRTVSRSRTELPSWCTNPPSLFAKHKLVHEQQRLWFVSSTSVSLKTPDPKARKKWGKALRHKHWRKWPQQPGVPRSQGQQTFLKGRPGMRVLNLQFHSDLVTNQQQGHVTPTDSQQSGGPPAS